MDIKVIGIRNAGEDNERLLIRVINDCNLKGYLVVDNTYDEKGNISNVYRHLYVLPSVDVNKGNIIRLYTHKGSDHLNHGYFGKTPTTYHNFYWGFDDDCTIWNKDGDTPYILHYDEVAPEKFQ